MKKFFLSAIIVMACAVSTMATDVKVTMNAISTTMTLVNKATSENVAIGEPANKVYTFSVEAGTYVLTGYDTDGITVNGTMELNINGEAQEFKVFTITTYATNSDWVYGTDYTIDLSVVTKDGKALITTLGDSKTAGRKTFLVLEGSTYFCDLIPTDVQPDYATLHKIGTINSNVNANGAIPLAQEFKITAPEDAIVFVGRKTAHFVPFVEETAISVEGSTHTYRLAQGGEYNYRVSKIGGLTQGGVFKADGTDLTFTDADFTEKSPKWIDHDVKANNGYNVADIFLNINKQEHLKLSQGATYELITLRNWEIVNSITANYFIEPDYHFIVTDLEGNESDNVVKIDADGTLHAVGAGAAIVTVTYDAIHLNGMAGGEYWSALWPENTGVFVVTVGDAATNIDLGMTINETNNEQYKLAGTAYDADFDVLYFADTEDSYPYTFKPTNVKTVKVAYPTIGENIATYNGFSTDGVTYDSEKGEYTVQVKLGRQIVQLTNEAGVSEYQVLVGKPVHIDITAAGRQQTGTFRPGDEVKVQLTGLFHPANKLAGIHNFNATTIYTRNGAELKSKSNQYIFCSTPDAQAVSFTIPQDYDITAGKDTLKGGVIRIGGFGDPIGNHRNTNKTIGRAPNFTAVAQTAIFGTLPQIILPLEARPEDKTLTFATNVDDCVITVKDYKGNALTPTEGAYKVNTFDYTYLVEKKGYHTVAGTISITTESPATIVENITLEAIAADDNSWDGFTTSYEPEQEDNVYVIKSGYNMAWFAKKVNDGTQNIKGKLANDISLGEYNWTPVGGNSASKAFKGQFDGQGHTISGLYINATTTYQGLFGYVQDGEISNLSVSGNITTTANNVAGIAAYTNGTTKIDRCANFVNITSTGSYVGGITANTMNKNVVITNCCNLGTLTGVNYVAGISANVQNPATIQNVFNYGQIISAGANVGAIRGHLTNGNYENIYAVKAYVTDTTATVNTTICDAKTFAKGTVAEALGEAFGQKIGTDAYPVLGGSKIYKHEDIYLNTEDMPSANAVASLENEEGGIQLNEVTRNWLSATPENPGRNEWKSGDYTLYTYSDETQWGTYYYGFYASNETKNTSTGYMEPYRSAVGGAAEGNNFGVWSNDYYSTNSILSKNPLPAVGFYVTNNAYTVNSMAYGDGYAKKFEEGDYLNLVCVGKLAGVEMGTVVVELAKGTKYIKDWTYVDLSPLGQVNEVAFYMEGSDSSWGYLNTPAYFCFDNFGAAMPENYEVPQMSSLEDVTTSTENEIKNEENIQTTLKFIQNGQVIILRDGKMYNVLGVEL